MRRGQTEVEKGRGGRERGEKKRQFERARSKVETKRHGGVQII